jgi:ABC-type transport system involved in cytochrome bd biosynthesis fused ATPase/permease subunit
MAGLLLLSGIDRRFGTTGAILSIAVPGLIAALVLRSAARTMNADVDRMLERLAEEERTDAARAEGRRFPLLSCERLDVAYGPVQVLFDVSLTVAEGELLAIVGTNGAGKSTLLATLAGTLLPFDGTIRFDGTDITYLDAERRVGLGITSVRAGEAVFGPLSVSENLRLFARSLSPGRAAGAVDDALTAFPALAERRDHRAATLSGGRAPDARPRPSGDRLSPAAAGRRADPRVIAGGGGRPPHRRAPDA